MVIVTYFHFNNTNEFAQADSHIKIYNFELDILENSLLFFFLKYAYHCQGERYLHKCDFPIFESQTKTIIWVDSFGVPDETHKRFPFLKICTFQNLENKWDSRIRKKVRGYSSDGKQSVLDKMINNLDDRTQVAYGSKNKNIRFKATLWLQAQGLCASWSCYLRSIALYSCIFPLSRTKSMCFVHRVVWYYSFRLWGQLCYIYKVAFGLRCGQLGYIYKDAFNLVSV